MMKEAPQMIPQSRGNSSQLIVPGWFPSTKQGPATAKSTCYSFLKRLFADQSTNHDPFVSGRCICHCAALSRMTFLFPPFSHFFLLLLSFLSVPSLFDGGLTGLKGCAYFYHHIKHINLQFSH